MKLSRLLIVLVLVFGLTLGAFSGCNQDSDSGDGGDEDRELITVSMNVMNAEKCGNNAKSDFIKENFGIEFEYVPTTWGDWSEKITTWISTDSAPDLIWWDLKGASSQQYRTYATQGAYAPIDVDMLRGYSNLDSLYTEMESDSIRVLTVDDELYAWPSNRMNIDEAQNTYESWWIYRRDWAKAVGMYNEGDVYTFDEWKALIAAVMEQDPGGNGTGNTAGLVMATWAFPHAPVLFIGPVLAEGNETCSYIEQDGEYVWPPATEEYKEGVIQTYEMYNDGLIYKDNISFKSSEAEDMFRGGLAFATYHGGASNYNLAVEELMKAGLTDDSEAVGPAIITFDDTAYYTQTENFWTVTAFNNDVEEEKMDRVFEFWNYAASDEGILLRQVGLEGTDYEIADDGTVNVLWDMDSDTNMFVNPYSNIEFNEATSACLTPLENPADIPYGISQVMQVREYMGSNDVGIKPFDYDVSFFSAPNKDQFGTFGVEVKNKMIELLENSDDIGADWDAYIEEMMPKVQPILDEINNEFG